MLTHFPRALGKAFVNLIYPPLCLACKEVLLSDAEILCPHCLVKLEMISPEERCPFCFSPEYNPELPSCNDCLKNRPVLHGIAAAFDYLGPAACLVKKLKYADQAYLAEGLGAYMSAQFLQLNWPMPDYIIPVPIAFTHWLDRGYNQSLLLANHVGKLLSCPVIEPLKRKSGDFSQAGLSRKQRMQLNGSCISLNEAHLLQDKSILLIDDVMTTGSTLRKCAEALCEGYPSHIYGLCVCRAF